MASFTDVGSLDLHTAQIDWGDGFVDVGIITEANGNGVIGGKHTYADNGNYTVTVTLLDDDGGSHVVTFTVLVSNVAPALDFQLSPITPSMKAIRLTRRSISATPGSTIR